MLSLTNDLCRVDLPNNMQREVPIVSLVSPHCMAFRLTFENSILSMKTGYGVRLGVSNCDAFPSACSPKLLISLTGSKDRLHRAKTIDLCQNPKTVRPIRPLLPNFPSPPLVPRSHRKNRSSREPVKSQNGRLTTLRLRALLGNWQHQERFTQRRRSKMSTLWRERRRRQQLTVTKQVQDTTSYNRISFLPVNILLLVSVDVRSAKDAM